MELPTVEIQKVTTGHMITILDITITSGLVSFAQVRDMPDFVTRLLKIIFVIFVCLATGCHLYKYNRYLQQPGTLLVKDFGLPDNFITLGENHYLISYVDESVVFNPGRQLPPQQQNFNGVSTEDVLATGFLQGMMESAFSRKPSQHTVITTTSFEIKDGVIIDWSVAKR